MAGPLTSPNGHPAAAPPRPAGDRRVKVVLLVSSGLTLAFLVAAMVRENFLSPWRYHQRGYRTLLLASEDEALKRRGRAFRVEVRQIDLPQLGTTDRCVSCHLGMEGQAMASAPRPHRTHPSDLLKYHPVEKYGCTICHQGQGAATNFHDAEASDAYWDYPILPSRLMAASCGVCHAAGSELMAKHAPQLFAGQRLFGERGCQSCHKLEGVGGQLGPALDGVGSKIKHQLPMARVQGPHTLANWLEQHFDRPQAIVPGSQMRPPRLTRPENEALTIYMLSLRKQSPPQAYVAADRVHALSDRLRSPERDGGRLYDRLCANCHGSGGHGTWDRFFERFVPAVRGPGLRAVASTSYLETAIRLGRPGTLMPAWDRNAGGLSAEQINALVLYLQAGDGRPAQQPRPAPATRGGDAERGGGLFRQLCAGCHGAAKQAPSLGNPVFLQTASDEFLARTISNGRADTAMPAFQRPGADGLTDDEVRDLTAYIRSLGKKQP